MAYSTSAALEMPELADGQPLVKPRALPTVRTRSRRIPVLQREAAAVSPFAIVGFIVACVMVALCLYSRVQLDRVNLQQDQLQTELSDLQAEYQDLSSQYEKLFDYDAIRSQMEANGSMLQPDSSQVIYMDLSQPDSSETYQSVDSSSHSLITAMNSLKDAVD